MANPIGIPIGYIRQLGDLKQTMVDALRRIGNLEQEMKGVKEEIAEPEEPETTKKFSDDEKRSILKEFEHAQADEYESIYATYGINRAHLAQWRRALKKGRL
jgi:ABC-type Fe2+-enterobactin transport system substrate-binding protein